MRKLILVPLWALLFFACAPPSDSARDAGPLDASETEDAGRHIDGGRDAGTADAGDADAGSFDAGLVDAGHYDAGPRDASEGDGGDTNADAGADAGATDPGTTDAGNTDASTGDADTRDGGNADADRLDGGGPDANAPPARDGGDVEAGDGGAPDAGPDDASPHDGGVNLDAGPSCPSGQTLCGGACTVVSFDPSHCGACDARCEGGPGASAACLNGSCISACEEGKTLCGSECVDVSNSTSHCGGCHQTCEAPIDGFASCDMGQCVGSCLSTDSLCDGVCIPVVEDVSNCGGCGAACTAPAGGTVACVQFSCVPSCPADETNCNNECVNTTERSEHCGACDSQCPAGSHCETSICVRDAPILETLAPSLVHARAQSILTLTGERLAAPVSVWLERNAESVPLPHVLSSETSLQVRLPLGLPPGRYAIRAATPSGETRLLDALSVVDEPLRIEVLRAGQGDAQIVTSPDGTTMVIDGSIEPVGIQTLRPRFSSPPDYVVVTHYDADHLAGIYALLAGPDLLPNTSDDVDPKVALLDHGDNHSCSSQLCSNFLTLRDRLESIGKARTLEPGEVISLGAGVTATCVLVNGKIAEHPRRLTAHENENSVGLHLEFLGFSYLAAGDVTGGPIPGCSAAIAGDFVDVETPLARLTGRLDVLKVAHHGSCTATPLAFSALAQPQVGIVSMGENNAFCHPSQRVLQNLFHLDADLYLTNPGVSDANNASSCPLSELPPTTAPFFSDVLVQVPGDGTFTVRAGEDDETQVDGGVVSPDGGVQDETQDAGDAAQVGGTAGSGDGGPSPSLSYFKKTYAVLRTRSELLALDTENVSGQTFEFVGNPQTHPVSDAIRIRSSSAWRADEAYLVPLIQLTDDLLRELEASQAHDSAVAAAIGVEDDIMVIQPLTPLPTRTQYAVVLPPASTGRDRFQWLHFTTGLRMPKGAQSSLVPPPASASGILTNVTEVTLDFDKPVLGIQSSGPGRNLYLEELYSGAEMVTGTHTMSNGGTRVTLSLSTAVRTGPNGESCETLCPNMTYAIRFLGTVHDENHTPIDTETLHVLSAGNCADESDPAVARSVVRTFPSAVSIGFFANEPIEGEVRIAPSERFQAVCDAPTDGECIRIPLARGVCSGDPCAPVAESCHHFVVSESLARDTDYAWTVHATDLLGKPVSLAPGSFTTKTPNTSLVMQEILVDSQQSPESQGEYIEVVNTSMQPVDLCRYRIGKGLDAASLKPLCSGQEVWLPALSAALLTGNNYCAVKSESCEPEFVLPAGTAVLRQSTATLLGGLSNASPPALYLVNDNDEVVSRVFDLPVCDEGESAQRLSLYGPDDPAVFSCDLASPGQATE